MVVQTGRSIATAPRRALDVVVAYHRRDPAGALATTRLVRNTPALLDEAFAALAG
ncbi:hypothetical protein ACPEIC_35000 [Stenotrophomonas sp. NPDC087984]